MSDATRAPLRMRYSFGARCRAVREMVAGASVHAAAASTPRLRPSILLLPVDYELSETTRRR
jgi:hypothetical protein